MEIISSILTGYIFGSIPTAFLLLKFAKKIDITKSGSNNVGALNSYEVTGSKYIGIIVLLLDAVKGILSIELTRQFFGDDYLYLMLSLVAAVFAHCYSPWLKFKGGRGLATAAGGSLIISPIIFLLWIVFWLVSYAFKRNIHFSNVLASILTSAIAITSTDILNSEKWFTFPVAETNFLFSSLNVLMMLIIISRHAFFIKDYFKTQNKNFKGISDE